MASTGIDISLISKAVREAAAGTLVSKAYLFGSRARGEARPDSDIDLCIEANRGFTLLDAGALTDAVSARCGCDVDVVSSRFMTPSTRGKILTDRILVHERT